MNLDEQLESLIDQNGVRTILERIAYIAGEKSEHLTVNWQEPRAGRQWGRLQARLDSLVEWTRQSIHV